MPLEGNQLGPYRLQRLVGSGSMSEIYLAQDTHIPRQVAVKVLRTEKDVSSDSSHSQEAERLFEREMQAISLLDHPHISPLFDYGIQQIDTITYHYLVMPYRPEGSLLDWLLRQESATLLHPAKIMPLLLQAADALQHAHERQILHQDIKPANFLIRVRNSATDIPDVLLADFGLAKLLDASSSASQSVRGTPIYMPPEQWEGLPVPASDQYALAVMAFLLLTGHAPFRGSPRQVMHQHFHVSPPAPSTINPQLSPAVDAVLLRALAKQPQERFPSVLQFAQALQQAFEDRVFQPAPLAKNRLSQTEEYPGAIPRGHAIAPLSSPGALQQDMVPHGLSSLQPANERFSSSFSSASLTPSFSSLSTQKTPVPMEASMVTPVGAQVPVQFAQQMALRSVLSRSQMLVLIVVVALIVFSSGGIVLFFLPGWSTRSRPQAAAVSTAPHHALLMATAQAKGTATAQARIIATAQAQGRPQLLWTFPTGGQIMSSPTVANGAVYVGSNDDTLYAINTVTARQEWTFAIRGKTYSRPAVVNGVVYTGSAGSSLYAIDTMTGQEKWAFPTGSGISASPMVVDGTVYISSGNGKLYAIDTTTGQQKWVFTASGPFWGSLIVADGVVYAGSIDQKLYAIDAATGREKWAFTTGSYIAISPTVANGAVYVGSLDSKVYAIDATTGQQKWVFVTRDAIWSAPTIANGVVYIGSHDHNLYAIDAASGQQKWAFPTGDRVWSSPTVVNGVVYVGSMDHKLYAIDVTTGQQKWAFPTGDAIQYSSPTVVNGVVYVGSNDQKLYAIAIG